MPPEIQSISTSSITVKSWLTCQYPVQNRGRPTSSTRTRYTNDRCLPIAWWSGKNFSGYPYLYSESLWLERNALQPFRVEQTYIGAAAD